MPEALAESPPLPERIEPESAGEPALQARSAVLQAPAQTPAARPEPAPEATATPAPKPGLLRRLAERRSPRRVKVSTALRFYHEVLGLDHLHYGLWNGEAFDLAGLKKAQDRFSRLLCEWVPPDVGSVLDVGCGIGSTALMLQRGGLDVEGLSPDPYHRDAFARRIGTPFHLSRFQEFEPPRRYEGDCTKRSLTALPSAETAWRNSSGVVTRWLPTWLTNIPCRTPAFHAGLPSVTSLTTTQPSGSSSPSCALCCN
jgi:hypothetical protein